MIDAQQVAEIREMKEKWVIPPFAPARAALDCDDEMREWLYQVDASTFILVDKNCAYGSVRDSQITSPVPDVNATEQRFRKLADEWSRETGNVSSLTAMTKHAKYREIVSLGWEVVPLMLSDLQRNRGFWFPALAEITGIRPFDPNDAGNNKKMVESWVKWGKKKHLI